MTLRTSKDINLIKKFCCKKPPIDNTLPHLFCIIAKIIQHNKFFFENTCSETFVFLVEDIHFETCPYHFKLSIIPSQTNSLHHELLIIIKMLVELCAKNYATVDGLVNGTRIFKDYTKMFSKSFIKIYFENP
jgi:hypothetical protein